nr:ABC transporter permease [Candidatus Palauibacterales bacterium]
LGGAAIGLNGTVLLFTAGTILVVTCLFGIVPALRFARPDPHAELKERGRTTSGGASHGRLRALHAGSEITLALVLLTGAGLMMKTMVRLSSVDPGFRVDRVQTMEIDLRAQRYDDDDARLGFWQPVLDRVRALPGVRSAAVGTVVPLTGNHSRTDITIEGMPLPRAGMFPHPDYHFVSPGYLATLEIPLIRGRDFGQADGADAPPVALVNAALARRYFPGQDPVGKRFMFGHPSADKAPEWVTIVGEVGDTKLYGLANPARLEVYLPFRQYPPGDGTLLVKSEGDPGALVSAIRGVVTSVDPDQPVGDVSTMSELRSQSVGERRMTLILLGIFSGLAVLLAAIGVYGVIAYSASRRVPEIAVRMALGAQRRDVLRLVLAQSGRIALAGIGVGVAAALALTRLMTGLLYGVSPSDPLTVVAAAALLGSIALLAGYLPARRAARVDPMRVLREE